jgi:hypothetical protein
MEVREKYEKVKQHLKDNRKTYIVGASCLTVGYFLRRPQALSPVFNNTVAPVIENSPTFINTVNNGGYARKIIRCIETDEMWPSMTKAAEAAGHTLQAMSKHIHGQNEHLDGLHYVIEGLAAS